MNSEHFKVVASVVTHNNTLKQVKRVSSCFLESDVSKKLIIVDNLSENRILNKLSGLIEAKLIQNGVNGGFSYGHNTALRNAPSCEYYLVLNPYVSFKKGTIEKIISFMDKNDDIGLVTPRILDENNSLQSRYKTNPCVLDLILRRAPRMFQEIGYIKKRLDSYEMKSENYEEIFEVPFVSGCFMLFRKSCLDKIGGFDERFFKCFEDADITRRISSISRSVYFPDAEITHHWKRGGRSSIKQTFYLITSAIRYFNKWGWKLF